ncbi:hypothetical protein ACHAW5_000174 [Stephanodiscus triporus]|uniref:GOLD domain-containing protein n=1 Tax=Stephanodiscus triporus TaxID=2934178 RepID=A0ABD3NDQ5_9STRA
MLSPSVAICLLILACSHFASISVHADGSYSHTIRYGDEDFDCLDSNVPTDPVRVALYNSAEQMIWSSNYGDSEGSFSRGGTGKHWLCLENGLTYEQSLQDGVTPPRLRVERTIGFSLRVRKPSGVVGEILKEEVSAAAVGGDGEEIGDVDDAMGRLVELADQLNDNFDALADHMSFMKAREMVHREIHEETFTKVVRWNILEICTVVVVAFGQVLNVWWIMSKRANTRYY